MNRVSIVLSVFLVSAYLASTVSGALPDPADPNLVLWLKADTAVTTGETPLDPNLDPNTNFVLVWTDQSVYANQATPVNAEISGETPVPVDPPKLETYTQGVNTSFPVIRYRFGDLLTIPGEGTSVDQWGDVTVIVVYNALINNAPDEPAVTHNLVNKFGDNQLWDGNSGGQYGMFLQGRNGTQGVAGCTPGLTGALGTMLWWNMLDLGSGQTVNSTRSITSDAWHVSMVEVTDPNEERRVSWYDNETETAVGLTHIGDCEYGHNVRPPGSTVNPLGIGSGFVGYIAEIIIYKKLLSPSELQEIVDYLNAKYFTPIACGDLGTAYLTGDFNNNCEVTIDDFKELALNWLKCTDPDVSACDQYWQ